MKLFKSEYSASGQKHTVKNKWTKNGKPGKIEKKVFDSISAAFSWQDSQIEKALNWGYSCDW